MSDEIVLLWWRQAHKRQIWRPHGGDYEISIFWDLRPCSVVEIYRRFGGTFSPHHEENTLTPNVAKLLPVYRTSRTDIHLVYTSQPTPREPQNLRIYLLRGGHSKQHEQISRIPRIQSKYTQYIAPRRPVTSISVHGITFQTTVDTALTVNPWKFLISQTFSRGRLH
jgi:hypothetical protein